MKITRRDFIKISAVAAGFAALADFAFKDPLSTLISENVGLERETSGVGAGDTWVPTTCWIGKQECGISARVVNGRVVKLEGHPEHPRNRGRLCPKGQAQIMALYDPYRVKAPLKRTNPKGKPGEWVEVSWDEALTLVGEKIKELKARDPRLLVWQKGRSKAKAFYDKAFVKASGATKLHHGAFCSDAGYRACEYTVGLHGVFHSDFRHCRYLLNWAWNIVNAGGNKLCWITWPRQFLEARERSMKVVTIDPRRAGAGPHTDEWLPIKPGTDMALFLAIANVLVQKGYIDEEYLKKHTNAPFLVNDDGYFVRDENDKEQVWDLSTGSAKPYDEEGIDPALEVDPSVGKTAFQVFKEHMADYTPEWAAGVCDVPADTIRKIAEELGENALIGSTIVLEGEEYVYRPVGIAGYHVTQQELGFQACRAALIVFMLLGAIEAVGGVRVDFKRGVHKNFEKLDNIEIKDEPYDIILSDSKFFPINSNNTSLIAHVMQNPTNYGVDYTPEVLIIHMANPVLSFLDQKRIFDFLNKFKFIVVIDPWMSETADYFADVVLPAATIEKYEGPMSVSDQYHDAKSLRLPPIPPLFKSRGDIDIYIDLCEKAGILYGEGGYIDQLNKALKLKDPYKLDLNTKPTVRDVFDRWARSEGIPEGIEYFEKHGVKVKPFPAKTLYASVKERTSKGIRHRLYGESLKYYQNVMKEKGVPEIYWRDYTPLPTWRDLTMEQSPPEYDLYLISYKKIEFKQSRSTQIALLNELEPEQRLLMNFETARARDIEDGDEVWVESHNPVTDETRKIKVRVRLVEGIRPDTVALSHHYGFWVHPWARGGGPTPNQLFFTGEGYITNTADQSFHVKVRVYKGR